MLLELHQDTIRAEWIDYNGHMNVAYYMLVFDHATDAFFDHIGLDTAYRESSGCTTYALEGHVCWEREVKEGDLVTVATRILDIDAKRLHYFHEMRHAGEGWLAATCELVSLHIDSRVTRAAPLPEAILEIGRRLLEAHRELPPPPQVGRVMGVRAGRPR